MLDQDGSERTDDPEDSDGDGVSALAAEEWQIINRAEVYPNASDYDAYELGVNIAEVIEVRLAKQREDIALAIEGMHHERTETWPRSFFCSIGQEAAAELVREFDSEEPPESCDCHRCEHFQNKRKGEQS